MLAIASALRGRGHGVTWLSQPSVAARAAAVGATFVPFSTVDDYSQALPLEDQLGAVFEAMAGDAVGDDVRSLLGSAGGVDAAVVDGNLLSALVAIGASEVPSAVLLHSMFRTYVEVWFGELWPFFAAAAPAGCDSWSDVFARHERVYSVVPRAFDAPVPVDVPAAMRHAGFLVPDAATSADADADASVDAEVVGCRVVVSMSTTNQQHGPLLQTIVDGVGLLDVPALVTTAGHGGALRSSGTVVVRDYVPHASVLAHADVVVTHGGLGTVAGALHAGVPLVCLPLGRDQPLNAERVVAVGAGLALDAAVVTPDDVARAVDDVLRDDRYRDAAREMAVASTDAGGAAAVADDLEGLA